jgi:hypothetical protein
VDIARRIIFDDAPAVALDEAVRCALALREG